MKYAFVVHVANVHTGIHFDILKVKNVDYQKILDGFSCDGQVIYCSNLQNIKGVIIQALNTENKKTIIKWYDTKEELTAAHFVELL